MIRTILVLLFLLCFFIASIPMLLYENWMKRKDPDRAIRSSFVIVTKALRCVAFFSGVRLTVKGLEHLPDDQPVLYIGNHRSYFDIVTLFPLLRNPTSFVAKKELDRIPFISHWMHMMRCPFLDRENTADGLRIVKDCIELIREGISICVFPEGTRTGGDEMLPFKEGTFMVAQKAKCLIVPVAIIDTDCIFENHIPFIKSTSVTIRFGKPVDMQALERAQRRQVPAQIQQTIADMIQEERNLPAKDS